MPGLIAIAVGFVVLLVVLAPLVALSYRRRGGFSGARMLGWIALLFYALALWAYTLLPLPESGDYRCVGVVLNPLQAVLDIATVQARDGGSLLGNAAVQQVALNVLLFVPLGVFARLLFHRGVVAALATGFAVSLAIELTQLTGVWGVYPCAYRLFDTGDLAANTLGAVLGSLFALIPVRFVRAGAIRGTDAAGGTISSQVAAGGDRSISAARRWLAMTVDLVLLWVVVVTVSIAVNAVVLLSFGRDALLAADDALDGWSAAFATATVAIAQLVSVLAGAVTLGERAVLIAARESRRPTPVWRLVRFATGIGGYAVFSELPGAWSLVATAIAICAAVGAFTTRGHRGFAQLVAGMDAVAREPEGDERSRGRRDAASDQAV
ncbi:Glycopeptide antibiotics resistance protein [Agromyces sp. CF514]|nr:Glycopeptide antibiotics resistance protein [Agromyces sp. CF514]